MTTEPIIESDMTFGPYPEDHCFYIEKSKTYQKIQNGVQIAEFLLLRFDAEQHPTIWIIEAKSSSPRPETQPNFDEFIAGIKEKLVNAFSLGWASCMGRHQETDYELPASFRNLDLSKTKVRFVLVIKGHQEGWLPPLQEALTETFRSTIKTWNFSPTSVAVINEELAKEYRLILPAEN